MNVLPSSALPVVIPPSPERERFAPSNTRASTSQNQSQRDVSHSEGNTNSVKHNTVPGVPLTPESKTFNEVVYGAGTASAPNTNYPMEERKYRAGAFTNRVKVQVSQIESGSESERNVKFQNARLFMEPSGYFSGGLLAAGYDPHEKVTATFTFYTGMGSPKTLVNTVQRTYSGWEIAAGALEHDKVERGGPVNFSFMKIESKDQNKVDEVELLGKQLQGDWEHDLARFMRAPEGEIAARSGKADAYALKATLESLSGDKEGFVQLSPEGQEATKRTLLRNGQVIIPNLYGYPLAGYAFIPYVPYDGDYTKRPNQGLMVDLKNGAVREIHGDKDFVRWAETNHSELLGSFNAEDAQGGKDAHWPSATYVLDTSISGANAHFPGYNTLLTDKQIPVAELFNYTLARGENYQLKYGSLEGEISKKYQDVNANNALWSDQTQVFGASQQSWKRAKEIWGGTFGFLPIIGNVGNIVFGIHDGIHGKTADDRVGGTAGAVLSGLQLTHEVGEQKLFGSWNPAGFNSSGALRYAWKRSPKTSEFELVQLPKGPKNNPVTPAASKEDPEKLVNSGIAGKPNEAGRWEVAGEVESAKVSSGASSKYEHGDEQLDSVITRYKEIKSGAEPSEAEKNEFVGALTDLLNNGNNESYPKIDRYVNADSNFVNKPLRAGRTTPRLEAFLKEFNQLPGYVGKAYRSAYVPPEGAKQIKDGVGKFFQDKGVQSASVTLRNGIGWEDWAGDVVKKQGEATQRVTYVFDPSVPKKNLSTGFLNDHVGIGPGEPLQVLAVKEQGDTLFVYASSPSTVPDHIYDLYSGNLNS